MTVLSSHSSRLCFCFGFAFVTSPYVYPYMKWSRTKTSIHHYLLSDPWLSYPTPIARLAMIILSGNFLQPSRVTRLLCHITTFFSSLFLFKGNNPTTRPTYNTSSCLGWSVQTPCKGSVRLSCWRWETTKQTHYLCRSHHLVYPPTMLLSSATSNTETIPK